MTPIEDRVMAHIRKAFGDPDTVRLLAAVSGGPDSMALLYMLHRLEIDTVVCHVNYRKRGAASRRDAELVEQISFEWGFDCHTVVPDEEPEEGTNFQQWARDQRYHIFRSLAEEYAADAIAVAHHRDDQVETILQKLFRGAGLESWGGMRVHDDDIFRPLLEQSREEIDRYIEEHAVPCRVDRSNLESEFARNFLRNEWLEQLEEFFPGWRSNILNLPDQASLFRDALDELGQRITDDRDRINREELLGLNPALRRAVILYLLKQIDPSITLSRDALMRLDELETLQTGKEIELNRNFSVMRDRDYFKIVLERERDRFLMELTREQLARDGISVNGLLFEIGPIDRPNFTRNLYLDLSAIDWPLLLRYWQAGDSFQPFGMEGHQNVSDHLTNRKTDAEAKSRAMVLESFDGTICAVIFPPVEKRVPPGTISELVRCDSETKQSLMIHWNRNQN